MPIPQFIEKWRSRGRERADAQTFWIDLLHDVLEITNPTDWLSFETHVHIDRENAFIDARIPRTHVLIEQKSRSHALDTPIRQSDGSLLTPIQQAQRYTLGLPYSQRPRWIVTSNFAEIWIYDLETPNAVPVKIQLEELATRSRELAFLVDAEIARIHREQRISLEAGKLVGKLYDALLEQYADPTSARALHSLNILCVRLVFCLYAEDSGVFPQRNGAQFHDYLEHQSNPRTALIELFRILNQRPAERDPYIPENLAAFPYVNGGLFADDNIEIPRLTPEIMRILLTECSEDFDWSDISPTIFGGVFESTLNPVTRRTGGMHYTSPEIIHRTIDPLFFNDLRERFSHAKSLRDPRYRREKLLELQTEISQLTFLDPACGSGNFLTETFISLRKLENEILTETARDRQIGLALDETSPIKVSIQQFFGIEINDFAVTVAKTALWIAEHQMHKATAQIVQVRENFLPLTTYANIVCGNALTINWKNFAASANLTGTLFENQTGEERIYNFIIGNPPFVGYSNQSREQKAEMLAVFGKKWPLVGKLDFVCAWYKIAADVVAGTPTRAAFVSTNSITQGEQVAALWKNLFPKIQFDFAWRTFKWKTESEDMAHVHCVIIGFSTRTVPATTREISTNHAQGHAQSHAQGGETFQSRQIENLPFDKIKMEGQECPSSLRANPQKIIFSDDQPNGVPANNINGYLMDAPEIFVENRKTPICNVPAMTTGNRPSDGGNLIIEAADYENFIRQEPRSREYIKKFLGSDEFIKNKKRYCLWLVNCPPNELRAMRKVYERVQKCSEVRLASPDTGARKLAEIPHLMREQQNPEKFILVPSVSSERREYVPMGFLDAGTIASNLVFIIPAGTLFHFGVLESRIHMAWMRAVAGRLKSDYRYSASVVYNNFV